MLHLSSSLLKNKNFGQLNAKNVSFLKLTEHILNEENPQLRAELCIKPSSFPLLQPLEQRGVLISRFAKFSLRKPPPSFHFFSDKL